jgi:GDP-mannose 6-dehydrogenase
MRISVFGIGYVGIVSCGCLTELGHEVIGVDIVPEKLALLRAGKSPIVEDEIDTLIAKAVQTGTLTATDDAHAAVQATDVSFVSVGTPSGPDGSVNLVGVQKVIKAIGESIRTKPGPHTVVMRSTVPAGTAENSLIPILEQASERKLGSDLHYYSNPEFLREGSSVADFRKPPFTLIGAPPNDDGCMLKDIYATIEAPIHVTSIRLAESIKHISNVFHAVKLTFANEVGAVLASLEVDARDALRLLCEDKILNISSAYLRPGFAFGGSCLPKDVRSFNALASRNGVATPMLNNLLRGNYAIIERVHEMVMGHGRQTVALFGLAFKQGTDDLRESPFVLLAEKLLGKGYDLRIYDRFVEVARLLGSNRDYIDREIPHLERLMVRDPQSALQGAGIAIVGHVAPEDRQALMAGLSEHLVIDLVGMPDLQTLPSITYKGLCW